MRWQSRLSVSATTFPSVRMNMPRTCPVGEVVHMSSRSRVMRGCLIPHAPALCTPPSTATIEPHLGLDVSTLVMQCLSQDRLQGPGLACLNKELWGPRDLVLGMSGSRGSGQAPWPCPMSKDSTRGRPEQDPLKHSWGRGGRKNFFGLELSACWLGGYNEVTSK